MFAPSRVSVGTTAVQIFSGRGRVRVSGGGGFVYLGPTSAVAAAPAAALPVSTETFDFFEPTELWAIVAAGSTNIDVLATDLPRAVGLDVVCS